MNTRFRTDKGSGDGTPGTSYRRMEHLRTEPSWNGEFLFSELTLDIGPPSFLVTEYFQVGSAAAQVVAAAASMARRNGRPLDSVIAEHLVLCPNVKRSVLKFDWLSDRMHLLWEFDNQMPIPMAVSRADWYRLVDRGNGALRAAGR